MLGLVVEGYVSGNKGGREGMYPLFGLQSLCMYMGRNT